MTAISDRRATPASGTPEVRPYTPPRVNLLPPEFYSAQAMGRLKRVLALVLVLVVALSAGVYGLFSMALSQQRDALAEAEAETSRLLVRQQDFAEVPVVLNRLEQLEQARTLGMSTEVLWQDYLGYVLAVMPGGVKTASVKVSGATPMLAPAATTNPLLQDGAVTQLELTAISDTLPNIAQWQDNLNQIPGFQDAWVNLVTVGEDEDTKVPWFELSVTVQVTDEAYANRYLPTEEEG